MPTTILSQRGVLYLLIAYFFSGIVGLCYEVLWIKMLALHFGVSIFGVVITVSAFMAGLGLGSLSLAKKSHWVRQPLLIYAAIEFLVAFLTFCLPELFRLNQGTLNHLAIDMSAFAWMSVQLAFAFFILFIPAFLMGAGFVFVLRSIKAQHQGVAYFYGINALGAAIGAILPLLLIPLIGWLDTLFIVASLGMAVALACFMMRSLFPPQTPGEGFDSQTQLPYSMLFNYACIGLLAMVLQIAWTRLFGMLMLRTEYVAAMIICVFILGISLGSLAANRIQQRYITWIPVLIGVYVVLGLWILPHINAMVSDLQSWSASLSIKALMLLALALPVTTALGAWLPMLTEKFQDNDLGATKLYAFNSLGAALGAAITGFVLLPLIGANAAVAGAGLLFIVSGSLFAMRRFHWIALALCSLAALPVIQLSPVSTLLPGLYPHSRDLYVHEDAISLTQVVEQEDGQRVLLSDLQRMDASSDPTSVQSQKNQLRLPLLLHADPQRVLLLGLGTGISASAALNLKHADITAVEISQGAIIAAKKYFTQVNDNIGAKINIVNDDARHFLMAKNAQYDVIVGDLFHPDLVGRSALLSLQQFARVKSRLNDNGVFVQWLALNQFDVGSLEIMLRTFKREFTNAHVFVDGFRIALVGFKRDANIAFAPVMAHDDWSSTQLETMSGGEGKWTWLGRYAFAIADSPGSVQDEWKPQIEYRLPKAKYNGDINLIKTVDYIQAKRLHVDKAKQVLAVPLDDQRQFENAYIANVLSYQSWIAELKGNDGEAVRLIQLSYQANRRDRWVGFNVADRIYAQLNGQSEANQRRGLEAVLKVRADHVEALKTLYRLEQAAAHQELASAYLARIRHLSPFEKFN